MASVSIVTAVKLTQADLYALLSTYSGGLMTNQLGPPKHQIRVVLEDEEDTAEFPEDLRQLQLQALRSGLRSPKVGSVVVCVWPDDFDQGARDLIMSLARDIAREGPTIIDRHYEGGIERIKVKRLQR